LCELHVADIPFFRIIIQPWVVERMCVERGMWDVGHGLVVVTIVVIHGTVSRVVVLFDLGCVSHIPVLYVAMASRGSELKAIRLVNSRSL